MTIVTLSIEQIDYLLENLKRFPPLKNRELTFMEVGGYPHFENVCSNILSFYLQPNNEHGFGMLFLDIIAAILGKETIIDGQDIEVVREELTNKQNRIDLVIKSENYTIGIENKIHADFYNDFEDYSQYLESISKSADQVSKILLCLKSPKIPSEKLYGFILITYEVFFQKIVENIGSYFLTAQQHHTTFLRDFIKTMQNLDEVTSLDPQRLKYFYDNHDNITLLLDELDMLRKDIQRKVERLNESIAVKNISNFNIQSGVWKPLKDLIAANWYIIEIDDSFWLQVDFCLTSKGWTGQVWNKKGTIQNTIEWVNARNFEVQTYTENNIWRLIYTGENNSRPYLSEIEDVQNWALNILHKLTVSTPLLAYSTSGSYEVQPKS